MTSPTPPTPEEPTQPPPPPPPPHGGAVPPTYGQIPPPGYGQVPPPGYGQVPPGPPYGAGPAAPYGVHPVTGVPYSEKQKLVAGLLQILIPLGIGRFYMGDTSKGVAQLLVTIFTCGIGAVWPFIDGILILTGDPKDELGRPLRG